jgi:hypothetical protein
MPAVKSENTVRQTTTETKYLLIGPFFIPDDGRSIGLCIQYLSLKICCQDIITYLIT